MTTLIIIAVSAVLILGLIGLNAWLGGWTPSTIDSLDSAAARLRQDLLAFEPDEGVLAKDKRAALVMEKATGRIGLVVAQGDILVSRLMSSIDIARITENGTALDLRFRDFTFPNTIFEFDNADVAAQWRARLTGES
ncbi:hypothetical protein [Hyphobacterium sp.]|uniref:hypothetical protein n=1 Tax=Hyphobacterium sp. TaxID=2004662 RepID=UPI00374A0CEF